MKITAGGERASSRTSRSNVRSQRSMITAVLPGAIFLLVLVASTTPAQNFAIDWCTVDSGGGTSSGGSYALNGTIGQPDAGKMSGGNYAIDGGFWSVIAAVQTPGAPFLQIALTSENAVVVTWTSSSTGFELQQNSVLGTTNWVNVTNSISGGGGENQVIISPLTGNRFYRLFHP